MLAEDSILPVTSDTRAKLKKQMLQIVCLSVVNLLVTGDQVPLALPFYVYKQVPHDQHIALKDKALCIFCLNLTRIHGIIAHIQVSLEVRARKHM